MIPRRCASCSCPANSMLLVRTLRIRHTLRCGAHASLNRHCVLTCFAAMTELHDSTLTKPFLFPVPLKAEHTGPAHFCTEAKVCTSGDALELIAALKSAREKLLHDLSLHPPSSPDKAASLSAYLAIVLPLVPGTAAGEITAAVADARDIGTFTWESLLSAPGSSQVGDVLYDACCMLLASALWDMAAATELVKAGKGVLTTETAAQANKLLKSSASQINLLRQRLLPLKRPVAPAPAPAPPADAPAVVTAQDAAVAGQPATTTGEQHAHDLEPQLLQSLEFLALAQAQILALLRAIAKGHQPGLVSAIAVDTAALYLTAFAHMENHVAGKTTAKAVPVGPSKLKKVADPATWHAPDILQQLGRYMRYMAADCFAFAYAFAALESIKELKGGIAVRLANEAVTFQELAETFGAQYDRSLANKRADPHRVKGTSSKPAMPADRLLARNTFQDEVDKEVEKIQERVTKDNSEVFYEKVPTDLPKDALPAGKRVVEEEDMTLPGAMALATPTAIADLAAHAAATLGAKAEAAVTAGVQAVGDAGAKAAETAAKVGAEAEAAAAAGAKAVGDAGAAGAKAGEAGVAAAAGAVGAATTGLAKAVQEVVPVTDSQDVKVAVAGAEEPGGGQGVAPGAGAGAKAPAPAPGAAAAGPVPAGKEKKSGDGCCVIC